MKNQTLRLSMLNKKYFPNLGFVILLTTVIASILFIRWVFTPFSYEEANYEENLGHRLTKEGKYKEASKHFLNAAKIDDNNISVSRRYRCAATTSSNDAHKIKYYKLALKYNPNNQNAKEPLSVLLKNEKNQ